MLARLQAYARTGLPVACGTPVQVAVRVAEKSGLKFTLPSYMDSLAFEKRRVLVRMPVEWKSPCE